MKKSFNKTLNNIYWGIQVNAVLWIAVVCTIGFSNGFIFLGFSVAAILEHIAVRQLGPHIHETDFKLKKITSTPHRAKQ